MTTEETLKQAAEKCALELFKWPFCRGDRYIAEEKILQTLRTLRESDAKTIEELKQCCRFTADDKPVKLGSTLYLYPCSDISRPVMTLTVEKGGKYCWYNSPEDAVKAAMSNSEKEGGL